jgi:DNA-binding response OmpR family regulator
MVLVEKSNRVIEVNQITDIKITLTPEEANKLYYLLTNLNRCLQYFSFADELSSKLSGIDEEIITISKLPVNENARLNNER